MTITLPPQNETFESLSMPPEIQSNDHPEIPSLRSRIRAMVSCVVSVCVLVWFLSFPFRMRGSSLAGTQPAKTTELDAGERIKRKKIEAERYQYEAMILDEQFMQSIVDKYNDPRLQTKPGIEHAREHRRAYQSRLQREIQLLGRPKAGSTQWDYQQFLMQKLESNEDSPL